MRRKKRRRKEAKARQRNRATTQPSTGRPGSKAVCRKLSAGEAEAEEAEGRPHRPTSSTLDGGEATRRAALAEPVSSGQTVYPSNPGSGSGHSRRRGKGRGQGFRGPRRATGAGGALGE